nr:hypothetical protein GCM10020093_072690 [Planobispora longispora]
MTPRNLLTTAVALAAAITFTAVPAAAATGSAAAATGSAAAATDPADGKITPALAASSAENRVIVEVKSAGSVDSVADKAEKLPDTDVVQEPSRGSFIVVTADGNDLQKLAADPNVLSIRKEKAVPPSLLGSVRTIGGDRIHATGVTGAGQSVAILDTGIDRDHPFFAGRIVAEACFSPQSAALGVQSLCPNGQQVQIGAGSADAETARCLDGAVNLCDHGSHVAGIAAGKGAGSDSRVGVAPDAGIVAIQVFSRVNNESYCGAGNTPCVLAFDGAIREALGHVSALAGSHQIASANLSLGGGQYSGACDAHADGQYIKPVIDQLQSKGVATVIAAGNESYGNAVSWPACVSSAVTVGATDNSDRVASFSNRGTQLDVFAPGVAIDSSIPDDSYARYSGTSMAAPMWPAPTRSCAVRTRPTAPPRSSAP